MDVICLPEDTRIQMVLEAKNGSNYALGQLLAENYNAVYKYILKYTMDSQLAADITQECMLRVIQKFSYYDPQKSSLSTWMITIAKNLLIEEYRRNKRKNKYVQSIEESSENCYTCLPSQDQISELIEKDELLAALGKLSMKERIPVILKHSDGYSYEEIAKVLKIPLGTVKSRIFNAMKSLKKELEHNAR